jgi:N-terminal acetyltransferase 2
MSKEYGWTALAVYLGLSALDFPFCFIAVRMIGTETIGRWEHTVKEFALGFVPETLRGKKDATELEKLAVEADAPRRVLEVKSEEEVVIEDHGYKEAERANRGENASKPQRLNSLSSVSD